MTEYAMPTLSTHQLLPGRTSQTLAHRTEDYPWGRKLRCRRDCWVERGPAGANSGRERFVAQTTDPRDGRPCEPKRSVYSYCGLLLIERANDHLLWFPVSLYYKEVPGLLAEWRPALLMAAGHPERFVEAGTSHLADEGLRDLTRSVAADAARLLSELESLERAGRAAGAHR